MEIPKIGLEHVYIECRFGKTHTYTLEANETSKQFVYRYRKKGIMEIVLYPSDQTVRTIIDIVQSGRSSISWVFNNEPSLLYDPTIIGPAKVFSNRQLGDYVVMNGNSGLAAAVSGSYGFTWNNELGHAQDDAAQIAVASNSPFANLDV